MWGFTYFTNIIGTESKLEVIEWSVSFQIHENIVHFVYNWDLTHIEMEFNIAASFLTEPDPISKILEF